MKSCTHKWVHIAQKEYGITFDANHNVENNDDNDGGRQCDCLPPYFFLVTSEEWADELDELYAKAISRHSSYRCDLFGHILSGSGVVFCPEPFDSALVGQFNGDTFFVSHFCPKGLKSGRRLLQAALRSQVQFVFAVPQFLTDQLVRLGFRDTGQTVNQLFNDNVVTKHVITNRLCPKGLSE